MVGNRQSHKTVRIMNGVVLWSDAADRKAVIWCEDHGDLAFYRQPEGGAAVALDVGDWVQFDLTIERSLRCARNPRLMGSGAFTGLADRLTANVPEPARARRGGAEIVPFHTVRDRRRRAG